MYYEKLEVTLFTTIDYGFHVQVSYPSSHNFDTKSNHSENVFTTSNNRVCRIEV